MVMRLLTGPGSADLAVRVWTFSSCNRSKAGTMRARDYLWGLGRNGLLFAGFVISVVFWLLEASNHVLFFADSDVFEAVFAPTWHELLSLIHISEPTRPTATSRMPSSA